MTQKKDDKRHAGSNASVPLSRPIRRIRMRPLLERQRVTLCYDPDRKGVISKVGPEVTEVIWDGNSRNNPHYIPNNLLRTIPE